MKKEIVKISAKKYIDKKTMTRIGKAIRIMEHLGDALDHMYRMYHFPDDWDKASPKQIDAKLKKISNWAAKLEQYLTK